MKHFKPFWFPSTPLEEAWKHLSTWCDERKALRACSSVPHMRLISSLSTSVDTLWNFAADEKGQKTIRNKVKIQPPLKLSEADRKLFSG